MRPSGVVPHHHAAGVARQALGRFRGNARAVLEDGLARRIGIRQDFGVHVDHDLVALPRGAGIEAVVQSRLGEQRQRVGLLLGHRRRFRGNVDRRVKARARAVIQRLAAAARACRSSAPTSGSSRPRTLTMPSSS